MKEKEKGRFNPFMAELRINEEILWLYMHPSLSFRTHLFRYVLRSLRTILIVLFGFGVIFLLMGLVNPRNLLTRYGDSLLTTVFLYVVGCAALIVPLTFPLFVILYRFSWMVNKRTLQKAYAVTNQRLLSYSRGRVSGVMLEAVGDLNARHRTISFGRSFPGWGDVEEAEEVLQVIQQAQINLRLSGKPKHDEMLEEERVVLENEDQSKRGRA